jgi:arsenate reductase-like glutaredoxin family protein
VNAGKNKLGRNEALRLAGEVTHITVSKGKKVVSFDMKHDPPGEETLLKHMLGPTGNLRAPTIKIDDTLLVGFNDEAYRDVFED